MKTNSAKAWLLASRPKTLAGASVPVMIALALAWADGGGSAFRPLPAVLCMLFALDDGRGGPFYSCYDKDVFTTEWCRFQCQ